MKSALLNDSEKEKDGATAPSLQDRLILQDRSLGLFDDTIVNQDYKGRKDGDRDRHRAPYVLGTR